MRCIEGNFVVLRAYLPVVQVDGVSEYVLLYVCNGSRPAHLRVGATSYVFRRVQFPLDAAAVYHGIRWAHQRHWQTVLAINRAMIGYSIYRKRGLSGG